MQVVGLQAFRNQQHVFAKGMKSITGKIRESPVMKRLYEAHLKIDRTAMMKIGKLSVMMEDGGAYEGQQ
jgi:hypothetical protein